MRAEIDAVKALLSPRTVYFVDVPATPTYPYVLLWTSAGSPSLDQDVTGSFGDTDDMLGVTVAAATPEAALAASASARAALFPGDLPRVLTVTGRSATLTLTDSRPVAVDTDVTLTATGRHPAFAVDVCRLISTPA